MRDQSLRLFVFAFYQTEDGRTRIQCRFEAERADSNLLLRVEYKLQHVAVDAVALVGAGPSSKTWPRWMPELALRTSTRVMPSAPSSCRLMAPATGLKKLGQPVPLSN